VRHLPARMKLKQKKFMFYALYLSSKHAEYTFASLMTFIEVKCLSLTRHQKYLPETACHCCSNMLFGTLKYNPG
jgi:hypothetical protein